MRLGDEDATDILIRAVTVWGFPIQEIMAIEELSELIKEVCKAYRGRDNHLELVDEIADVTIMLEQLKLIFGLDSEEINNRIDFKLNRIVDKLNKLNINAK